MFCYDRHFIAIQGFYIIVKSKSPSHFDLCELLGLGMSEEKERKKTVDKHRFFVCLYLSKHVFSCLITSILYFSI